MKYVCFLHLSMPYFDSIDAPFTFFPANVRTHQTADSKNGTVANIIFQFLANIPTNTSINTNKPIITMPVITIHRLGLGRNREMSTSNCPKNGNSTSGCANALAFSDFSKSSR